MIAKLVSPRMVAVLALLALALPLAGCGEEPDALPAACLGEPGTILAALEGAPAAVALADGTRLSRCVSAARTDGDLQALGLSLTSAADTLRARARSDPAAALRLGYLAGAVRTGAASATSGIAEQLARRVGQVTALEPPAGAAAVAAHGRGERAGAAGG